MFAASLAAYAEFRRRSTKPELVSIVRHESRFLLVCVPQIVLLLVLKLAGLSLKDSFRVVIWTSAASLGFWGGIAARRASLRWRGIALGVIAGLAAGGVVLLLQLVLQPGKVVSNGVAAIRLAIGGCIDTTLRRIFCSGGGLCSWAHDRLSNPAKRTVPPGGLRSIGVASAGAVRARPHRAVP